MIRTAQHSEIRSLLATIAVAATMMSTASAKDDSANATSVLRDGRIGYVTTDMRWSLYQTPDASAECPDGLNEHGPREVFSILYPKGATEAESHLKREALKAFPEDSTESFPFFLATGLTAIGLNLDGKVDHNDFTSPTGEQGIDNELYRVIGCIRNYRAPDGQLQLFANRNVRNHIYNRSMIELTGVDSLVDDDDVTVTIYRGLDRLLTDSKGDNIQPGGTQRVDHRFGKRFNHRLKGKIVDGVLMTEPQDVIWPWTIFSGTPGEYKLRGMRLRLNLSETKAEGLMASYADIKTFYRTLTHWSMHYLAYGQLDPSAVYRELRKHADAFPDENGQMTAISSSIGLSMTQVFIDHGEPAGGLLKRK